MITSEGKMKCFVHLGFNPVPKAVKNAESAIGFAESTIKNSFGENIYDSDLDIHFKDFLKSALNYSASYDF